MFRTHHSFWALLIPSAPSQSAVLAEHFFNCACSLMARHLRDTVENSLTDLVTFLSLYKVCEWERGGGGGKGGIRELEGMLCEWV